uniref:Putative cytochrome P450 n=1 Tax=Moniliophthora roreri TaxID=221103 RepID=A0A0W0GBY3_MONRR
MESVLSYLGAVAIVLCWLLLSKLLKVGRREATLPPGPPTIPILGNLHVFPKHSVQWKFTEWARKYGEIYSLKLGSKTAIVLTDMQAVKELLDKRSLTTADRIPSLVSDLVTGGIHMALARYDDVWKIQRRVAQTVLTPSAVQRHLAIQRAEATQLMYDFLDTPENFFDHLSRYSTSVIMSVLWGKRCPRHNTKEATEIYEADRIWNQLLAPGTIPPIDMFPFLNYIPERWAKWKSMVKDLRERQRKTHFALLDDCAKRIVKGEGNGSYMEEVLSRQEEWGLSKEILGYIGTVLLEAASHTMSSFLQTLVLFLVAYPKVQRKAQEELDRVVGDQRAPTLEDFGNLPYIQAIIEETHRIRPVAPTGIPHATTSTEEFRGYVLPAGTAIFSNNYGIFHDPEIFQDPEIFNPDRFLLTEHGTKPGVDDSGFKGRTANLVFGFGRRICPGVHLAHNSLALNTMNLLWAFDFRPAKDPETDKELPVDVWGYEEGFALAPKPFKCRIIPRGEYVKDIVEREFHAATDTFVKYERDLAKEDSKWVEEMRSRW